MLQGPAFFPTHGRSISDLHPNNTHHTGDIAHEQGFALFGLIVAAVRLLYYILIIIGLN